MLAVPWYFAAQVDASIFQKIYFTVTLISLFWGLIAGTLVDRYNRKQIFVWINIVGLITLSIATVLGFVLSEYHWIIPAVVYGITFFIYNIHFPALYAFAQEITPASAYGKVTSKLEIQGQLTWTIAGGLAALLISGTAASSFLGFPIPAIKAWPIHWIFLIDACTYVCSLYLIYKIIIAKNEDKIIDTDTLGQRLKTGFSYLKRHPLVFVFGNASLAVFVCIILQATLTNPTYVKEHLHASGAVYAWSDMFFSGGALLAGFFSTRLLGENKPILSIAYMSVVAALMFVFQVFNTNLSLFFASFFVVGICNAAIRIQRITFLFRFIPNHLIGRASSVFFMSNILFRLGLTAIFTMPIFLTPTYVSYACGVYALVSIVGAVALFLIREKLILAPTQQP
jgi:DHA3 family macrolide efflux protein-like MFS transporter